MENTGGRRIRLAATLVVLLFALVAVAAMAPTAAASSHDCSFPTTETDATGTDVTMSEEPDRIVALYPSAAQTIWEVGGRDRVVGLPVDGTTGYLDGAHDGRTDVLQDNRFNVDVETVVALEPDLVVAPNVTPPGDLSQLRDAGLTVYHASEAGSLNAIADKTAVVGRLVGECRGAATANAEMDRYAGAVDDGVAGRTEPRSLFVFPGGSTAAGDGTFVGDLMERAGSRNIAADEFAGYQEISDETVVADDPEWIVTNDGGTAPRIPQDEPYASTTALNEGQTLVVDANRLSQAGPRVVIPMTEMARAFHPGAGIDEPPEQVVSPVDSIAGPDGAVTFDDVLDGIALFNDGATAPNGEELDFDDVLDLIGRFNAGA